MVVLLDDECHIKCLFKNTPNIQSRSHKLAFFISLRSNTLLYR